MSPRPAAGRVASEQDAAAGRGVKNGASPAPPGAPGSPPGFDVSTAPHTPGAAGAAATSFPLSGPGMPVGEGATQDLAILARARWPEVPGDTLTPTPPSVASRRSARWWPRSRQPGASAPATERLPPAGAWQENRYRAREQHGHAGTSAAVAQALAERRRVPPLLFFQSNVNAVIGHVASRWGLAGPIVCACPTGDLIADGLACAALLFEDGDASEALVIAADQGHDGESDSADAVLVAAWTQRPRAWHPRGGQQEAGGLDVTSETRARRSRPIPR